MRITVNLLPHSRRSHFPAIKLPDERTVVLSVSFFLLGVMFATILLKVLA